MGRLDLASHHPRPGLQRLERARDPAGEPAAAERHQHLLHAGKVLDDFDRDGGVAGHHRHVRHGVDERPVHPVVAVIQKHLPPAVERHRDGPRAQPLERGELDRGRMVWHDRGEGDVALAGTPGEALRHVARARGVDPLGDLLVAEGADGVAGPADLERADRLERFELEPDLPRAVVGQPDQRGAHRGVFDPLARLPDGIEGYAFGKGYGHGSGVPRPRLS